MKLILALDSSQRLGGSVTLLAEDGRRAEVFHDRDQGYAESFFALVDEGLERLGSRIEEVGAIVVIRGPGSFTGLRIGVMTAKSLAFALDRPLYAAGSLQMLALAAGAEDGSPPSPDGAGSVLALLDAGRGAAYAAAWSFSAAAREAIAEPQRLSLDEVAALASRLGPARRVVALGENVASLAEELAGGGFEPVVVSSLASIAAAACRRGDPWCPSVEPSTLLPVYLGLSQAERIHGIDLGDEVHRLRPPRPGK